MKGKMLWFNAEKEHGFIQTEEDERLYVERSGFRPGEVPEGRCAGRDVVFERVPGAEGARAVDVAFPPEQSLRRARLRRGRGQAF